MKREFAQLGSNKPLRIGLVVPHIFMQDAILPQVIFSPGQLALSLAEGLQKLGAAVTLFSPGKVTTTVTNVTTDLSLFEAELKLRGDGYLDLLKKHPLTFITLARQAQSELIATAFAMANRDELDVVHIYTNEEDIALPFAQLCTKPVVFTHHDPFNFLVKYKNTFPKFKHLNWVAFSESQKSQMPPDTHWLATIHHGLDPQLYTFQATPSSSPKYMAYLGRIIEPKGVHLAIEAVKKYNAQHTADPLTLKIAGKHYTGTHKDSYWAQHIEPEMGKNHIEYVGYLQTTAQKQVFLGNATALLMPSTFAEPFGMVMLESLACGTPIIGLHSGAIPEIVSNPLVGYIPSTPTPSIDELKKSPQLAINHLVHGVESIPSFDRPACRLHFESNFTSGKMSEGYLRIYERLHKQGEVE